MGGNAQTTEKRDEETVLLLAEKSTVTPEAVAPEATDREPSEEVDETLATSAAEETKDDSQG